MKKSLLLFVVAAATFIVASAQFLSFNETSVSNKATGSDEIIILHSKASVTELQRDSIAKHGNV